MTKRAMPSRVEAVVRPCPKCGRTVIRVEYDAAANYGRGATLLIHGDGHAIAGTRLHHVDACLVLGVWPNSALCVKTHSKETANGKDHAQ